MPGVKFFLVMAMLAVAWAIGEFLLRRLPVVWHGLMFVGAAVASLLMPARSLANDAALSLSVGFMSPLLGRLVFDRWPQQKRTKYFLIALPLLVAWILWRRSQWTS